MAAAMHSLWFTQMIEYEVPASRQAALANALVLRSEQLATRWPALLRVSVQASDDGSRVLQHLQWQTREQWQAACGYFTDEPFLELLQQHQARSVNFAAYQAVRSLVRGNDGGLHCEVGALADSQR